MMTISLSPLACALVTTTMLALTFYIGCWCGKKRVMDMTLYPKKVNEEIAALRDDGTFANLKNIDKKLGLPRRTSFEMGGFADYFASIGDD